MNISEQVIRAKEDLDRVYSAGAEPLYYAKKLDYLWNGVAFPDNYEMSVRFKEISTIDYAFMESKNLKSVKLICDTPDTVISASGVFRECSQLELVDLTEFNRKFNNIHFCFYRAYNLKTIIGALDVSECTSFPNSTFSASALETIEFVPNTIKANIWFNNAPKLTHDSLMSIINGLKDSKSLVSERYEGASASFEGGSFDPRMMTHTVENPYLNGNVIKCEATSYMGTFNATLYGCNVAEEDVPNIKKFFYDIDGSITVYIEKSTETKTLTLSTTNLAKLTDSEKAIATEKGWTLA